MNYTDTHCLPTLPPNLVTVWGTNIFDFLWPQNHQSWGKLAWPAWAARVEESEWAVCDWRNMWVIQSSGLLVQMDPIQHFLGPASRVFHQLTNFQSKLLCLHSKLHQLNPSGFFFHSIIIIPFIPRIMHCFDRFILTHASLNSPVSLSWLDKSRRSHQHISPWQTWTKCFKYYRMLEPLDKTPPKSLHLIWGYKCGP